MQLVAGIRGHEQHRIAAQGSGQEGEQVTRGPIGPMHVLDHQQLDTRRAMAPLSPPPRRARARPETTSNEQRATSDVSHISKMRDGSTALRRQLLADAQRVPSVIWPQRQGDLTRLAGA